MELTQKFFYYELTLWVRWAQQKVKDDKHFRQNPNYTPRMLVL